MAFIDKLKGIFIEVDESKKSNSDQTYTVDSSSSNSNPQVEAGVKAASGQNLQKFVELLSNVLEKNNFPGYDYFEFKKALQSVAKLGNMEESMMYKTVYAAAQSMNVNSSQLISTAKKYLELMENEKSNFMQSAGAFLQQNIKTKTDEVQVLEKSLADNKLKLEQLTKEIAEQEARISAASNELNEIKVKVEVNKNDFISAYSGFVEEIQKDIQKMESYLKD
jgi:hypothetical protein